MAEDGETASRISLLNEQIQSLQNEAELHHTQVVQLEDQLSLQRELYQKEWNETMHWEHMYRELQKQMDEIKEQDILSSPPVLQYISQVKDDTRREWEEGEKQQLISSHNQALNQVEEFWIQKYNDMVEKSKRDFIQYRANAIREKELEDKKIQEEMSKQQTVIYTMQQTIHRYEEERRSLRRLVSLGVKRMVASLARRDDGEVFMNSTHIHMDKMTATSTTTIPTLATSNSSNGSGIGSRPHNNNIIKLNKFLPMGAWRVGGSFRKRSAADRSTPVSTPEESKS
jgi:galactokinase